METITLQQQKPLNTIIRNKDENGIILTYSVFIKVQDGTIYEIERNTRKELKCFELYNSLSHKKRVAYLFQPTL